MVEQTEVVAPIGPLLVLEIGKLQGVQSTMLDLISTGQQQIEKIRTDVERRHQENQIAIRATKEQLEHIVTAHSKEDDIRFGRVSRIIWAAGGIFGFLNFVLLAMTLLKMFGVI